MASTSILTVCLAAFGLIFFLLSILSIMMRGLTALFPVLEEQDSATVAAITAAYNAIYPDRKITRIEETKQ